MSAESADLAISSRWLLPMTAPGEVLEDHTLVIRHGRIIDVLPSGRAAVRYTDVPTVDRSFDLLMPGMVNSLGATGPSPQHPAGATREDAVRLRVADMLGSGTTCVCSTGSFPAETARVAVEQGMRTLIGLPVSDAATPWADGAADCLTRALAFRDDHRGHPLIHTAFAPQSPAALDDATLARIATLAAELDAGIVMPLHESPGAIDASQLRHGLRPLERLHRLGLLTPALTALHMNCVSVADVDLAVRGGIAVALCPEADLAAGGPAPPVPVWARSGMRLGLGSAARSPAGSLDLWPALRLLALLAHTRIDGSALTAWEALATVTRGGAAALGLDTEIGTLEQGKWADVCCIDLRSHAAPWLAVATPRDCAALLVGHGSRALVSDVWIAGRQLLERGSFTRLDVRQSALRLKDQGNHDMTETHP